MAMNVFVCARQLDIPLSPDQRTRTSKGFDLTGQIWLIKGCYMSWPEINLIAPVQKWFGPPVIFEWIEESADEFIF